MTKDSFLFSQIAINIGTAFLATIAFIVSWTFLMRPAFSASFEMPYPQLMGPSYSMFPLFGGTRYDWGTDPPKAYGVVLSFEEKQALSIGDVVAYDIRAWENYGTETVSQAKSWGYNKVVHRIIGKRENGTYILKGDNDMTNPFPDDIEVKPAQIVFKVTKTVRNGIETRYP